MKNMVRNEDAFEQRFRTANGVRTLFFFFGFGAIVRPMAKKPEKKSSPVPFHENVVRKVYAAKISGPDPFFFLWCKCGL